MSNSRCCKNHCTTLFFSSFGFLYTDQTWPWTRCVDAAGSKQWALERKGKKKNLYAPPQNKLKMFILITKPRLWTRKFLGSGVVRTPVQRLSNQLQGLFPHSRAAIPSWGQPNLSLPLLHPLLFFLNKKMPGDFDLFDSADSPTQPPVKYNELLSVDAAAMSGAVHGPLHLYFH